MKDSNILMIGALAAAGFYFWNKNKTNDSSDSRGSMNTPLSNPTPSQVAYYNPSTVASRLTDYQNTAAAATKSGAATYTVITPSVASGITANTFSSDSKVYSGSIIGWTKDGRAIRS